MGQSPSHPPPSNPPPQCPVHSSQPSDGPTSPPPQCPVHSSLNGVPSDLPQTPHHSQSVPLPTHRTSSSIPRPGSEGRWEYPSPQQFYHALMRKGWETPTDSVEVMVEIHNFLNEKAWEEVVKWERRMNVDPQVQLARFQGRPGEYSPKARLFLFAGWLLPSRFNTEPPFDRHDWIVRRPKTGQEVRYVIDYYSAPSAPDGTPVFSLDVRPALDSFSCIKARVVAAAEDAWRTVTEREGS